ncbi:type II secretion system protein [Massilia sp. H6]|uniref:type II secretion system protein n=1 Tax=Massilia sp. H6 TaxID=2970464 RepID=UPI002168E8D8|nr:type II secretion system protein [Massilia sp. H6]UVW28588.1 type II secretion system GspH family protein [Massilia sp. H6]
MRRQHAAANQRGFSLVELVIVIVLTGVIGGIVAMQLGPTIQGYMKVGRRAGLTDQADTALRRIVTDVRAAVPNSLRLQGAQCLELVPTSAGGRYRTGPDVAQAGNEAFLEHDAATTRFDVVTSFNVVPAGGDLVVIGNQNPDDVYNRRNAVLIDTVETRDAGSANAWMGPHRINLRAPISIPFGYDGGRFVVVPAAQATSYVCNGDKLFRITRPIAATQDCSVPSNSPVLATGVTDCQFVFSPNQGATQQSGFIQLQLTLSAGNESVPLTLGAHVSNVP